MAAQLPMVSGTWSRYSHWSVDLLVRGCGWPVWRTAHLDSRRRGGALELDRLGNPMLELGIE